MPIHPNPFQHLIPVIDGYARSLLLWVLEALAWWVDRFGTRADRIEMQRHVLIARRRAREYIVMAVVARLKLRKPQKPRRHRPRSAQPGFRYQHRSFRGIRYATRGVVLKTLKDIRIALENFERTVMRALARTPSYKRPGAIVAVAPPASVFSACAPAPAPDGADTS